MKHSVEFIGERKTHYVVWDSINENTEVMVARQKEILCMPMPIKPNWLGRRIFYNWESVRDATRSPWRHGLEVFAGALERFRKVVLPEPMSVKRLMTWGDSSGDFDLDRFCEGRDPYRTTKKRESYAERSVTIAVQIGKTMEDGGSDGRWNSSPFWRGACAIMIAEALEKKGCVTEIMSYDYGYRVFMSGDDLVNAVIVKGIDKPIDTIALVNALSSWYFQTVNFASYSLTGIDKIWGAEHSDGPFGWEVQGSDEAVRGLTTDQNVFNITGVHTAHDAVNMAIRCLETMSAPAT